MTFTSKERLLAAISHREADRVPFWENYWSTTLLRWKQEGMPADAEPVKYFGLDPVLHTGIDWTCQFPTQKIEETDEYTIVRTKDGVLSKNFKHLVTTPFWWDFPLTDRASWEELKPRMMWNETRIDLPKARAAYEEHRDLLQIYTPATLGFERFKYIMGMEGILMALGEDPDWVREMCDSTGDLCINGLEYLLGQGFEFDVAFITEDMGYKDKAFFSPRTYREVIMPCQKRFCDFCHARGIKVMLHSCGQNMQLVPLYIEAGFDILNPLEVKAGMDIYKLKKDFGEVLTLWGGIDVRTIADPDPAVLEREIAAKVPMARQGGGYIFASDHSIPDNVSLQQYRGMLELGRKYGTFGA
jgi:uroporphyrinogen decarboxylase